MRKRRIVPPASVVGPPGTQAPSAAPGAPGAGEGRVHCRRVDAEYTVAQHLLCPYCFGSESVVGSGDHRKFCEFEPGKDPIAFGFPEDAGHYRWA